MNDERTLRRWLAAAGRQIEDAALERLVRSLSPGLRMTLAERWPLWVHGGQAEPPASAGAGAGDWLVWLLTGGRGHGKTRAGAEWTSARARETPDGRIALVAATLDEAVKVMIEGQSGLIAVARTGEAPEWRAGKGELVFPNGAVAFPYSAERPEGLRGPEHHYAWCDELAKWRNAEAVWANLMLGLRLGDRPRAMVTTTPKPTAALKAIIARAGTVQTSGRTIDNPHLPAAFRAAVTGLYGGTRLGRQELDGEMIEEVEGALWTREGIEGWRCDSILPGTGRGTAAEGGGGGGPLRQPCGLPPPRSGGGFQKDRGRGRSAGFGGRDVRDRGVRIGGGWARLCARRSQRRRAFAAGLGGEGGGGGRGVGCAPGGRRGE